MKPHPYQKQSNRIYQEIPKDEVIELEPCPGKKDQRVGDFRNENDLERVIGHKRGDDGIECITLYENVPFVDQYIPESSLLFLLLLLALWLRVLLLFSI